MGISQILKDRKPVWIALSKIYLDTELEDIDFKEMVSVFKSSPYTLEEIKNIDRFETWRLLSRNINPVAGIWDGFNEEWLMEELPNFIDGKKQNNFFTNRYYRWYTNRYWKKIDSLYNQ